MATTSPNVDVPPARPGEFAKLAIGPISVWPPVVLAPMAGVTNWPFRTICKEMGAGLYVSEMITRANARRKARQDAQARGLRNGRDSRGACSSTGSIRTTSAKR